jgi:hypothetical protein
MGMPTGKIIPQQLGPVGTITLSNPTINNYCTIRVSEYEMLRDFFREVRPFIRDIAESKHSQAITEYKAKQIIAGLVLKKL